MRYVKFILVVLVSGLFLSQAMPASADDVLDAAQEGIDLYKAGKYSEAAGSFEYAGQLTRQKRSGELSDFLPQPLNGWEAGEVESSAVGAMYGGVTSAQRTYTKGNESITVIIMTDSPVVQGIVMMIQNPMMMGGAGKIVKVGSRKAMLQFDNGNKSGDLQLVVANKHLVQISGNDTTAENLTAYAAAVNADGLENK